MGNSIKPTKSEAIVASITPEIPNWRFLAKQMDSGILITAPKMAKYN